MLTDLETERPLSPTIIERAEADLTLTTMFLVGRLLPHYPNATVDIVFLRGERAGYHIIARPKGPTIFVHGFRAAAAAIDELLDERPMTLAEIEQTLGADTAYSGNHNAA